MRPLPHRRGPPCATLRLCHARPQHKDALPRYAAPRRASSSLAKEFAPHWQLTNLPRMPRRSPPSLPTTTAAGRTGMAAATAW